MARKLESTLLAGPAGRLEALLEETESGGMIERAVVICHPHPQFGGTMHNKVVYRMARAARATGAAVLRFNYRGVGRSSGVYDGGRGEQDDLRAAMRYMRDRYPGRALSIGGFSFGARVSLRVSCGEAGIDRVVAVGAPVDHGDWNYLANCGCPKHFVHSSNDQYGSIDNMERVFALAAEPKRIAWVEARDHFFADALDNLEECLKRVWH